MPTAPADAAPPAGLLDHGFTRETADAIAHTLSGTACVHAAAHRYAALPWAGAWAVVRRDLTDAERAVTLAGVLTQSEG